MKRHSYLNSLRFNKQYFNLEKCFSHRFQGMYHYIRRKHLYVNLWHTLWYQSLCLLENLFCVMDKTISLKLFNIKIVNDLPILLWGGGKYAKLKFPSTPKVDVAMTSNQPKNCSRQTHKGKSNYLYKLIAYSIVDYRIKFTEKLCKHSIPCFYSFVNKFIETIKLFMLHIVGYRVGLYTDSQSKSIVQLWLELWLEDLNIIKVLVKTPKIIVSYENGVSIIVTFALKVREQLDGGRQGSGGKSAGTA